MCVIFRSFALEVHVSLDIYICSSIFLRSDCIISLQYDAAQVLFYIYCLHSIIDTVSISLVVVVTVAYPLFIRPDCIWAAYHPYAIASHCSSAHSNFPNFHELQQHCSALDVSPWSMDPIHTLLPRSFSCLHGSFLKSTPHI